MESTLFVSDLDGTLLDRESRMPAYTVQTLNRLLGQGLLFTFATARSYRSTRVVTEGISSALPWIVHNGVFLVDSGGRRLFETFFTAEQTAEIRLAAKALGLSPLVYSILEGAERVSYLAGPMHPGKAHYVHSRQEDPRLRLVPDEAALYQGDIYYFTFIDSQAPLRPLWGRVGALPWLNGTFQRDLYREEYWLELTPQAATKAAAALRLKKELGCRRLVAFGDAMNDLPLFAAADECYATANALPQVKATATGVIGGNEEGGVAEYLVERLKKGGLKL